VGTSAPPSVALFAADGAMTLKVYAHRTRPADQRAEVEAEQADHGDQAAGPADRQERRPGAGRAGRDGGRR
jgi:hypothetical protein